MFTAAVLAILAMTPVVAQDVPLPRPRPHDRLPDIEALPRLPAPEPLTAPDAENEVPDAPIAPPESRTLPPLEPHQSACPAVIAGLVEAETLPPVAEGDCGAASPLRVTAISVNGRLVPLSAPATLTCPMATQLPAWAAAIDSYLAAREGTRLDTILSGTSYACRNVNNAAEGNLSAHAFVDALDVTGFVLEDGRSMTLPEGWKDPLSPAGRALRFAHGAACSLFSSTLGPEANPLHADHFHLDMACHGAWCTARLCE